VVYFQSTISSLHLPLALSKILHMRVLFTAFLLFTFDFLLSQKKPLDHTVYDIWQNIGERMISNDGK